MSKSTNLTSSVFGDIVGNQTYDKFLQQDDSNDEYLARCKELYARIVEKNRGDLETLAKLEETITQIRCKEAAKKDFKLSQVRGYIYARTPFFRKGKDIKDIRVVIGKTSTYGTDLNPLYHNKELMLEAKSKLLIAITTEITNNMIFIENIEEKYQNQCQSN
jgi:hypothetical protein